jgi:hypothetical protein
VSKTIPQLKSMWNRGVDSYKTQEVGSGVQGFVKDVLECPDIFNLKEGELSTPKENRKNEFIYEKKTRDGRRADFAIYINSDIIIPIEAEQYTNIQQGEGQLFQYQSDLEKKYGILTDGYTWRFYNNSLYRAFTLDHLLSQTDLFLEYWKEYIKPEYYYLSFFEEAGQLSFFGKEELHIEDNRQLFFEDITTLINSFRNKLSIEGYLNGLETKEAKKKATEITYAYIIQFILYKTLVDNEFDDFGNDYKGRIETIRNAIKSQSYKDILGVTNGMSRQISENIYRPFVKEQEHIGFKLLELFWKAKNELSDVSPWLDIVVFIKKYSFQNVHNEIFGYVYENYLKDLSIEEEKRGQYFTDPSVVNFMLEQVGYTATEIRSKIKAGELDKVSIVDPACGSGTFLYRATDEIVKSFGTITDETSKQIEEIVTNNVFGLDVEEFPLYLAEMGILMRMLPLIMGEKYNKPVDKKIKVFWTQDSIAEFIGSQLITLGKQTSFPDAVIKPKFESFMRTEEDLTEMKGSMTSIPRRRFDYVIANPPYISYNECSKQELLIFDLIKKKRVQLNDIFGVNLHSIPDNRKKYAPKPNLYAFFLALGLSLLKDDGRLCYIIPQTILTAGDLDVLRYHLAKHITIEKVITFNRNLFIERGLKQKRIIPTSSLILIVGKNAPSKTHEVEVINYNGVEDTIKDTLNNIVTGKEIDTRKVKQADLLENATNWNFIKQDKAFLDFCQEYENKTIDISVYYKHTLARKYFGAQFIFDIGHEIDIGRSLIESSKIPGKFNRFYTFRLIPSRYMVCVEKDKAIFDLREENYDSLYHEKATFLKSKGFKISEIGLLTTNQGYQNIDTKFKIIWSKSNSTKEVRFYFTEEPVVSGINTYGYISSNNKPELLYLFALLNSPIVQTFLRGKLVVEEEKNLEVVINSIKKYVRVPLITSKNKHIKKEIIERTEQMLALEEKTLSDFVDFSGVMMQKFDDVQVTGDTLALVHGNRETKLSIQGDTGLIAGTIAEKFGTEGLKLEKRQISLSELRNLQVIDFEKQAKLKDYIDDLVFALYFNILLKEVSLDKSDQIHEVCSASKYYQQFNYLRGVK